MMKKVNAIGDACPIPVVKTKNAIKELNNAGGTVETLVDNEIAVQNLTKMANQKGYAVTSEKVNDNEYKVVMTIEGTEESVEETPVVCVPDTRSGDTVVVLSSNCMGSGDDALGAQLMKAFIFALTQQDALPKTIICYNGGVKLTSGEADTIEDLKSLEAQGVEILSCGTCLNFYGLADQLKVGGVTNMYTIVEKMMESGSIIKP